MKYDLNQIILADCMDIMRDIPDKYFELAIVDPPYGIGMDFAYKNGLSDTIHSKKEWNDDIPGPEYFVELHRISNNQIIWGCNYYAKYIEAVGRIVHDKELLITGTKIKFSEADLASCSLQKRITIFRYKWNGNVQGNTINWNNTGWDKRIHPTQKPVSLYRWLLQNYAKPGDKIIDTHSGSGSCAIACHIEKHDFLAIEKDPDYHAASVKRLEEARAQGVLF